MGPGKEPAWYLIHYEPNTSMNTDLNLTVCGVSLMANVADEIQGHDFAGQSGPLDTALPGAKLYNDFNLCIQQTYMLRATTRDSSKIYSPGLIQLLPLNQILRARLFDWEILSTL